MVDNGRVQDWLHARCCESHPSASLNANCVKISSTTTSSMTWQRAQSADWKFAVVMTKTALVKPSSSMNMHILNLSLFYVTFSFGINKNSFSSDFAHHQCPTNRFACTQLPLGQPGSHQSERTSDIRWLSVCFACETSRSRFRAVFEGGNVDLIVSLWKRIN